MSGFKKAENPIGPLRSEEWKIYTLPIKNRRVLVSNIGRVRTLRRDYCKTRIFYGYEKIWGRSIHRMVAELFIDKSDPSKNVVNHIDGNKLNNSVKNLEWTDPLGNSSHAKGLGRYEASTGENHWTYKQKWRRKIGETNGRCKLKEHEARFIKFESAHISLSKIASTFGITKTAASYIRLNKTWRHL